MARSSDGRKSRKVAVEGLKRPRNVPPGPPEPVEGATLKPLAPQPGKYHQQCPQQAFKLCLLGATDADLAEFFGVKERTIEKWRRYYPEFDQAVRQGKEEADARVAEALYRRAIGFEYEATKVFLPGGSRDPVFATYIERVPPDTQAAAFWLKNRQPDRWRDRKEHTGANGGPLTLAAVWGDEREADGSEA